MNELMIEQWNKTVGKYDTCIVAGDFALGSKEKIIEVGQRLNGNKTLILGNHDRASLKTYYEAGFEIVSRFPIIYNDFIIISHTPQFQKADSYYANVFGHVHNDPKYSDCGARHFCVSAERLNYKPINLEEIYERMSTCGK